MSSQKGFTLFEIILSLALLTLLTAVGAPVYESLYRAHELEESATTAARSLRRASTLAAAGIGDVPWSVHVGVGKIVLFRGVDFMSRDTNYDEAFDLPESITPSGMIEAHFKKMTGIPETAGTLTFTAASGEEKTVTINAKGVVAY